LERFFQSRGVDAEYRQNGRTSVWPVCGRQTQTNASGETGGVRVFGPTPPHLAVRDSPTGAGRNSGTDLFSYTTRGAGVHLALGAHHEREDRT
jgi:hypothetical protein